VKHLHFGHAEARFGARCPRCLTGRPPVDRLRRHQYDVRNERAGHLRSDCCADPTAGPVSLTCPTPAAINAGLGLTVSTPIQTPTTGNPPGDSGVSCRYMSTDFRDVIILSVGTGR
jgi:hypothetical protein